MPTFSTGFTPPDPVANLLVTADIDASAIRLSWDQTALAQVDFGGYRVYRTLDGINYELLVVFSLIDQVAYDDFLAPLNVNATYRVTQSNLDSESDPAEGSATLESTRWWVVEPNDPSLTFSIPKLQSAQLTSPKPMEVYRPVGRKGALTVSDVVQAEEGEISFLALPDNLGMVSLMKRVQAAEEGGILVKATDGSVWPAQFGSMTRSFTKVGLQQISIPLVGVG